MDQSNNKLLFKPTQKQELNKLQHQSITYWAKVIKTFNLNKHKNKVLKQMVTSVHHLLFALIFFNRLKIVCCGTPKTLAACVCDIFPVITA